MISNYSLFKNKIYLCIILFLFSISYAEKTEDGPLTTQLSNKENLRLFQLENEITLLKSKYDFQEKIADKTFNSISNQLNAASYNLNIFGIAFAFLAIVLGVYITYVERKIIRISEESKSQLIQSKAIKKDIETINNLIQSDINGLFEKIKREETKHILQRLIKVPQDIGNLSTALLSRELEKEDFELLKKAYLSLKGSYHASNYELLFFQHFLDLSIMDEHVGPKIVNYFPVAISNAFENDIIKSSEDFINAIIVMGIKEKEKEINSFCRGLASTQYVSLEKIYSIFFNGLKERSLQFKFYQIISNEKYNRKIKVNFGQLLINEYEKTDLSKSEKYIIKEISSIKDELMKEEEKRQEDLEKKRAVEASKNIQD